MRTKAGPPLDAFAGRDLSPLLHAYFELNQLKHLYRQGWLRRGVPPERCESVAEHVFSMAMLAWWLVDGYFPTLDRERVIRMVLAHELGEVYVGDIIPGDRIPPEEKHRREREAFLRVTAKLPRAAEYLDLWEEFESGLTPEARLVRQVDRLEMACQAAVYRAQGYPSMEEFFASAQAAVQDPALVALLEELARP